MKKIKNIRIFAGKIGRFVGVDPEFWSEFHTEIIKLAK